MSEWMQALRVLIIAVILYEMIMAYRNIDMAWNMKSFEAWTGAKLCDQDLSRTVCTSTLDLYNYGLWQFFNGVIGMIVYAVIFGNEKEED